MSATHNESLRMLARITDGIRRWQNAERHLKREYIRERVTGQRRELKRETDAEVREYVREHVRGILTD